MEYVRTVFFFSLSNTLICLIVLLVQDIYNHLSECQTLNPDVEPDFSGLFSNQVTNHYSFCQLCSGFRR